jgi:hypothetical protein
MMGKYRDNFSRIKQLEILLERWCEYYVDGMSSEDIQDLYVDTLHAVDLDNWGDKDEDS